jgi:uncharacterized protein (DUF302 family)
MTRTSRSASVLDALAELASLLAALGALVLVTPASARAQARTTPATTRVPGIVTVVSASPFDSTLARLERAVVARGLTIAAKVDHAAAAQRANLTLRPTTLVIAGNPAAGTPLMQADQTLGVELPLRFLVWQGEDGKARVSYDPIKSIAARHSVRGRDEVLGRMTTAIEAIVKTATSP